MQVELRIKVIDVSKCLLQRKMYVLLYYITKQIAEQILTIFHLFLLLFIHSDIHAFLVTGPGQGGVGAKSYLGNTGIK